ncbi:MAG: universal stress protein [Rhodospirillaceae bacterium]|nr:universal stress protein [Rhodospirillaceae bacterium]
MNDDATRAADLPDTDRVFLVVVDTSEQLRAALRFACRRVVNSGGTVALFHAVPHIEFQHFATIGELMDHEAKTEAERLLQQVAADVHRQTGKFPDLYLRQGDTLPELQKVIKDNPAISMLVLGAGTGSEGPGPIVSAISGKLAGKIDIPVTIVPGDLSEERLDALT